MQRMTSGSTQPTPVSEQDAFNRAQRYAVDMMTYVQKQGDRPAILTEEELETLRKRPRFPEIKGDWVLQRYFIGFLGLISRTVGIRPDPKRG